MTERRVARALRETFPQVPLLAHALEKIKQTNAEAAERIRPVINSINEQFIENFTVHQLPDNLGALPASSISLSRVLEERGNSGQIKKEKPWVLFHGLGGNTATHLHTVAELIFDGLAASKQGREPLGTDFHLIGQATSPGGQVTENWIRELRKKGLQQHGEASAQILSELLPDNTQEPVILFGNSMGTYTASYAEQAMDRPTVLFLKHPPGHYIRPTSWDGGAGARVQLAGGFAIETSRKRIREALQQKKEQILLGSDGQFFTDLAPNTSEQRRLKAKARIIDLFFLTKQPTLPHTDTPTFAVKGVHDLTRYSPQDRRRYERGEREHPIPGRPQAKQIFTRSNHSPEPFSPHVINRMIQAVT